MNFLIFIITFLSAITLYLAGMIYSSKNLIEQLTLLQAKQSLNLQVESEYQKTFFYYLPGKIYKQKRKEYINFRDNLDYYERSKCNIFSCLGSDDKEKLLAGFFFNLYPKIFLNQQSSLDLVYALKKKAKKSQPETLFDLLPDDDDNMTKYLSLLNGVDSYPKLDLFFFFDSSAQSNPLCFRYAKKELFEIALGRQLANYLIDYERNYYLTNKKKLTKELIEAFLAEHIENKNKLSLIISYFSFKEPKKKIIHIHKIDSDYLFSSDLIRKVSLEQF